jgi:acyl-CoA hydrolase
MRVLSVLDQFGWIFAISCASMYVLAIFIDRFKFRGFVI